MQSGILAWTVRRFWDPASCVELPIFFPSTTALMSMDTLLGQALLVAPLAWVPPATSRLRARLAACERGDRLPAAVLDSLRDAGVMGAELRLQAPEHRVAFWRQALRDCGFRELPSAPGFVYFPLDGSAAH